jgi:PAS domain S-box-containing protein
MAEDKETIDDVRAALEASEMRVHGILETAVNAIITISDRGIIETVNEATVIIFGYERDEMIGQNVSMLMPSPYREQHDGYLGNYHRTAERKIIGIGREALAQRKVREYLSKKLPHYAGGKRRTDALLQFLQRGTSSSITGVSDP